MKRLFVSLLALVVGACSSGPGDIEFDFGTHAVGTYIGGGSVIAGPDPCTYSASPSIFEPTPEDLPDADRERGPRFILAPGTITQTCGTQRSTITAAVPDGALISGPATVKVGTTSMPLSAYFRLGTKAIEGKGALEWTLGTDCSGVAAFAPVMGSQDTGGPDRTRSLVATKPGACTVIVAVSTGNPSYPKFAPRAFQAEHLVKIE